MSIADSRGRRVAAAAAVEGEAVPAAAAEPGTVHRTETTQDEGRRHEALLTSLARPATVAPLLLFVVLALTACWMSWFAVYQVDDAFIVYRYARNLAQGHGFVFNSGERVEGVTCFLWTLLLAAVARIGLDLPRVAPGITALCGLALIALVARRHAAMEGRGQISLRDVAPSVLLASSPAFVCWAVGALETVPYALTLVLATREHALEANTGQGRRSALWLGVAALFRPEVPVIVLTLGAHRWWCSRVRPLGTRVRDLALWLATISAFAVPFVAFRRLYFGDWVPNTFHAKTGAPAVQLALQGLAYVERFARSLLSGPIASGTTVELVGVALLCSVVAYGVSTRKTRPDGLVVVAVLAAAVIDGGDWMFLHRFIVPALPGLAILTAQTLYSFACLHRAASVASVVVGLGLAINGVASAVAVRTGGQGLAVNAEGYATAHVRIAALLASQARPGDSVALMDIGMVGWYAPELRVIDITGLTDREIAHAPGGFLDKRFDVARLLAREPRFFVLVPGFSADERIVADAGFRAAYRLVFRVNHRANWSPPSAYYLHVFEREPH